MTIDRRKFLKFHAAISTGIVLFGTSAQAAVTPDDTRQQFASYLQKLGYTTLNPVPLVTGHPFNGGLQYDEDETTFKPMSFVEQTCARPSDFDTRHKSGTLPLFVILILQSGDRTTASTAALEAKMGYLTQVAQLDPKRFRLTTTDRASHIFPSFEAYGISRSQIRVRPWSEAFAAGDGSGYLNPKGHPRNPVHESISLEYVLTTGTELELGEFVYATGQPPHGSGIGVERVTMARNDRAMMWADGLASFKLAVEEDAKRNNLPLPPGYYQTLGLAKPN